MAQIHVLCLLLLLRGNWVSTKPTTPPITGGRFQQQQLLKWWIIHRQWRRQWKASGKAFTAMTLVSLPSADLTQAPISIQGSWMAKWTCGTLIRWWAREDSPKCQVQGRGGTVCAKLNLSNILPETKLRGADIQVTQDKIFSRRISLKTKLLNYVASLHFLTMNARGSSIAKIVFGRTNSTIHWCNRVVYDPFVNSDFLKCPHR